MIDAESVKSQVNIADIVGQYVKLTKAGPKELVALCPFHREKSPSFTVTPGKGLYKCFGCDAAGDVFSFVQRVECLSSFGDAVKRVAEISGVAPESNDGATAVRPKTSGEVDGSRKAVAPKVVVTYPYTDEQGELLYEVQRVEPGRNGKTKDFRQRRPHPVDGSWVWGISEGAYRKGQSGDWYPVKGEAGPDDDELPEVRRVLYRLPAVLAAETVYVVEGEKDVHTLEAAGLVATTNSGGASQKWLQDYTESLRGKRVIVIPDNDEPGRKRGATVVKALTGVASEVLLTEVPTGKDVTDYVASGSTVADLEALIEATRRKAQAKEIERRGLLSPVEIVEWFDGGISAFLDPSKRSPGLLTGFTRFDDMTLGLHGGELVILAARPAQGKTALALNIAVNVAERGQPVAVFSLEMSRESLLTRAVCARARIDQLKARAGHLDQNERSRQMRALSDLCEMPLFIDDHAGLDLKSMRTKLFRMRAEQGLTLAVIDYLQLMTSKARENRTQEVGALSRGLKLMARELKVPFLVLSQLSRAPEQRPGNHRPQLSDLRESGGIEQDADVVTFIFREEVYKPDREDLRGVADLIIAKQRNGPTGTARLVFLNSLTKFENAACDSERE